jgi:vacuolar-type H+-ATPase subunit F/Vma7
LTYDEAVQKLDELRKENKFGLCIITDEAAERVKSE